MARLFSEVSAHALRFNCQRWQLRSQNYAGRSFMFRVALLRCEVLGGVCLSCCIPNTVKLSSYLALPHVILTGRRGITASRA